MYITKKKAELRTPLVNPIIDLERPLANMLEKGEYKAIKYHNTPCDINAGSYEINIPYYGGGSSKEWLLLKDKLPKDHGGQSIDTGPQRCTFTERLLTGDAKT